MISKLSVLLCMAGLILTGCQTPQNIPSNKPITNLQEQSVATIPPVNTTTAALPSAAVELKNQPISLPERIQTLSPTVATTKPLSSTKLFESEWFSISYPQDFTASPSHPERKVGNRNIISTTEAYFIAPDKSVEFYVYAPFHPDHSNSYLLLPTTGETLVDRKTEPTNLDKTTTKVTRWGTFKAENNSYYRSFVSYITRPEGIETIKSEPNTSYSELTFGIKYNNDAAYNKYKNAYESFKKSIILYAD